MKQHGLVVSSILLVLCLLANHSAFAAGASVDGNVGGIPVRASKEVNGYDTNWTTRVDSYTLNQAFMAVIGWTWWTSREKCNSNGVIVQEVDGGFYNEWSRSAGRGKSFDYHSCSPGSSRTLYSMGTHDFAHGSATWRPYVEASIVR